MAEHPFFLDHLRFLEDGGKAMANSYPRIADRLSSQGLDPDVELLLRGVAFVASKIAERLGVSLTEMTQLAFDLMFPHYQCPIPACAIVELKPTPDAPHQTIARGTEVESLGVLGTRCRFATTFDLPYYGLVLEKVVWTQARRHAELSLSFCTKQWFEQAPEDKVRLYLHGEHLITRALFQGLLTNVRRIHIGSKRKDSRTLGGADVTNVVTLRPCGLADDEALFDYPIGSFPGFRVLQEYFAFPEKLLFVELHGLREAIKMLGDDRDSVTLRLEIAVEMGELVIGDQHVRLNCTPVANLFRHQADPIRRQVARAEYLLRPMGPHLHYELYRVLGITGYSRGQIVEYPLLSEVDQLNRPFAQLFRRLHDGDVFTYVGLDDGEALPPRRQTVLTDIMATNGKLPLALSVGDVRLLPRQLARGFSCRNITPLSPPIAPPTESELRRRLVAHIALGQRDMILPDALRDALDLYNFAADQSDQSARTHKLLLQGIVEVSTKTAQTTHGRVPIWGRATDIVLDEQAFDTLGDLYLFGLVLNEYVALQTPMNQYSDVTVRCSQTLEEFRWPKRAGPRLLSES